MRMWMVNPTIMCRQHLLGEHVEIHMLVGTINRGKSIAGFIDNRLVEPASIYRRHDELVAEMVRRGMRHQSPLPAASRLSRWDSASVDISESQQELLRRCSACRDQFTKTTQGE